MIYPSNIEKKIGFDIIKEELKTYCQTERGLELVENLSFLDDVEEINRLTSLTEEFMYILEHINSFPQSNFLNIQREIDKLKVEGYYLSEEELYNVLLFSRTVIGITSFFAATEPEEFPQLKSLFQDFYMDKRLPQKIGWVISDKGTLKNDASPELQRIRKDIIDAGSKLRNKVNRLLTSYKEKGFIDEEHLNTIRNGRHVIPVKSEFKRQIPGLIHDESSTGQTTFLEPSAIFDANNEVIELQLEEKREIKRILMEISREVSAHLMELIQALSILGEIDFIRSKAKLSNRLGSVKPKLSSKKEFQIQKAFHPLLLLQTKDKSTVVPLSVQLNADKRILIISGPNAGGKSVCLKTSGLLIYMLQCGLPVPVDPSSTFGTFKQIFVDIGDDQSIENDLSTYSSHLTNMKHFLFYANKNTLFLIDEFGTGTDPEYGGAIAESVLEKLHEAGAYGIVTTHYSNLKKLGEIMPSVENGAMLFDDLELKPLYQLSIGQPGNSYAMEIAEKIGLEKSVIQRAESLLGKDRLDYDKALKELGKEKSQIIKEKNEILGNRSALEKNIADYKELKGYFETEKKKILKKAHEEAQAIIDQANKSVERTIADIKKSEGDKKKISESRKALTETKQKSEAIVKKVQKEIVPKQNRAIQEGDMVTINGEGAPGKVVKLDNGKADLLFGSLKVTAKLERLVLSSAPKEKKKKSSSTGSNVQSHILERGSQLNRELDIRGKRVHEVLEELDILIDDAIISSTKELRIIHGKGNGILRDAVRNHLKGYKQITAMRDEHVDFGGSGVTVVVLD